MSESTSQYASAPDGGAPDGEAQLLHRIATQMFEIVPDFAPVFANTLLKLVPDLGSPKDKVAVEANRKSSTGSMYELLCITRAGLTDPGIIETSPEALEHVRYLRHKGVGFGTVLRFYNIGISMFEPLMLHVTERIVGDPATLERLRAPLRGFIFTYIDQITKRLAVEFGTEREGWVSDPNDEVWHNPEAISAVEDFLDQRAEKERSEPTDGSAARAYTEAALERFCDAMEAAAGDERLSGVLGRADTTVRIELLDDPELAVTLLLDRNPIEVVDSSTDAETQIKIVSVDLARLYSPDFHVAMAIARGRVFYTGPVRKFLRITPVIRHASLPQLADGSVESSAPAIPTVETT